MSKTTITLNKKYFTEEVTTEFLKDHAIACKMMELDVFTNLFIKYDLSFVEDFGEVLETIKEVMQSWNKPELQTELIEVVQFDSKCIFCEFGKTVNVYKWTYQHKLASIPLNRLVYQSQIAFFFDIRDNQLIEYGICNGYLDKEDINLLKS
ncbi:conserved hypothetical protein [Flavobacterium psychrophilum]|uniref:hypothetical protein n=1 Tax=Flavobacterium psychrophilum TaxID=96345 RepID=UPI000B7C4C29|nr:hypothetical protein [Flavobacterium psychrophilum]SNB23896.1 conserved hypothetical protein [Flavobacterium psychrophilum]